MYGVWKKSAIPQPNRRRKPLQPQKAAAPYCSLVAVLKPPHPHKEKNAEKANSCPKRQTNPRLFRFAVL